MTEVPVLSPKAIDAAADALRDRQRAAMWDDLDPLHDGVSKTTAFIDKADVIVDLVAAAVLPVLIEEGWHPPDARSDDEKQAEARKQVDRILGPLFNELREQAAGRDAAEQRVAALETALRDLNATVADVLAFESTREHGAALLKMRGDWNRAIAALAQGEKDG